MFQSQKDRDSAIRNSYWKYSLSDLNTILFIDEAHRKKPASHKWSTIFQWIVRPIDHGVKFNDSYRHMPDLKKFTVEGRQCLNAQGIWGNQLMACSQHMNWTDLTCNKFSKLLVATSASRLDWLQRNYRQLVLRQFVRCEHSDWNARV